LTYRLCAAAEMPTTVSKAPFSVRTDANQGGRWSAQPGRWGKKESDGADVVGPPRPLAVNTGREGRIKRQRDTPAPKGKMKAVVDDSQKKPRANDSGAARLTSDARDTQDRRAPGRPNLDRRVGGVAPNGNPQCWYAPHESETDPHRVAQRQKQVEYGKNSDGYKNFLAVVPKCAAYSL
jgi:Histone RNA hairpin-binding protein RNA-binding domain